MAIIRFASDLHLEFGSFEFSKLDDDKNTVLVLAGDIITIKRLDKYLPFLEKISSQFKEVVLVCGNHEYYGSSISDLVLYRKALEKFDNITLLNDESKKIDDVYFVGSTLWTDFYKESPEVMVTAQCSMTDYKVIKIDAHEEFPPVRRRIIADDILAMHKRSREFIFNKIKKIRKEEPLAKIAIVSHHAPHSNSIHSQYKTNSLNGAYYTDLEAQILETQPNLWFHGHVHNSFEYDIDKTKVLCNPRGYFGYEINPMFEDDIKVEL